MTLRVDLPAPTCPTWHPDGTYLAVIVRDAVAIVDTATAAVRKIAGPPARTLAWSPDRAALFVAHDDRDLQRIHSATGERLADLALGDAAIDELLWSPDASLVAARGDRLIVCDPDGAVRWRRSETRRAARSDARTTLDDAGALHVADRFTLTDEPVLPAEAHWSPDAALLAVRWGERCHVYTRSGALVADVPVRAALRWGPWGEPVYRGERHTLAQHPVRFTDRFARGFTLNHDGRLLAAEGDRHCLWLQDQHDARALPGHPRTITGMTWSRADVLATACRDGRVRRVLTSGALVEWTDDAAYAELAWSHDGARLAVCRTHSLEILALPDPPP